MAKKYRISKTKCRNCGGLISWDAYPSVKWPIHVDSSGNKIGSGSCPIFKNRTIYSETSSSIGKKFDLAKPHEQREGNKLSPKATMFLISVIALACVFIPFAISSAISSGYNPENPETPENPPPPPPPPQFQWEIDSQGVVTNIVDGDTFDMTSIGRVRLADIDCPDQGEPGCSTATAYMNSLIYDERVYVDIDDVYQTDVYGRYVCVTYVRYNSTHLLNVNKDLLVRGYATIWNFNNEFNPYEWPLYVYYV